MKHFQDYRMQPKNIFLGFLLIVLFSIPGFFSYGQTVSELQNKIDAKSAEIEKLESQIKQFQAQLNTLGKEKASLSGSIKQLDLNKKKLDADISVTQKKIDQTNLKIQGLSSQINTKEGSINNALDAIALDIKKTNEIEETSLIESILSENDFTVMWNDIDNMMSLREAIREKIAELKLVKVELEDTREVSIKAKNELTTLRARLADQKKIVEQNVKEKSTLLAQTKNSEANYQKLVADQLAKKQAFEKELEDYESRLKFILDPSSIPKGRVLSWPLDSILVTSPYGPRWNSFHRGTDFRASVGTPVKAVADGTVLGAGNTDLSCPKASFGQWILIEHSNGLATTYAHLSLIKVGKGDRVVRGSIIGYSGNTGSSTGPHLHLSLYVAKDASGKPAVSVQTIPSKSCLGKTLTQPIAATDAYLDPMTYLPPYSP
jgi:murein DD-endopeptidase MepM/ murein hydrolase activator NlpD